MRFCPQFEVIDLGHCRERIASHFLKSLTRERLMEVNAEWLSWIGLVAKFREDVSCDAVSGGVRGRQWPVAHGFGPLDDRCQHVGGCRYSPVDQPYQGR